MLWLTPGYYRYSLGKEMRGTDVAALQINLDVVIDGVFGDETENAVKAWQESHNLLKDGVAGPKTFQSLCVIKSSAAVRKYNLPQGMSKSIMLGESNCIIGAHSEHPSDEGEDVGPWQLSSGPQKGSQDFYYAAFNIADAAEVSCYGLADFKSQIETVVDSDYLQTLAGGDKSLFKWQMAVLSHNWPHAAWSIPKYGSIFQDEARDDQPAQWIITATNGTITTPRQWVTNYVRKNTLYVKF
jgi:hypothetical protein